MLGSARYSLKAGERRTVTIALAKGVRKLAVKRAIAARAQTVTRDAAGNVAPRSPGAVSLRRPRPLARQVGLLRLAARAA